MYTLLNMVLLFISVLVVVKAVQFFNFGNVIDLNNFFVIISHVLGAIGVLLGILSIYKSNDNGDVKN